MVWALVLVAVAAIGVLAWMRRETPAPLPSPPRDDEEDDDDPPRIDSPRLGTQRPKQILTPSGTQPIALAHAQADEPRPKTPTAPPIRPATEPPIRPPTEPPIRPPTEPPIRSATEPPVESPPEPPMLARTKSATIPPIARPKAPTIPPPQQAAAESGLSMRTKRPSSSPPLTEGGVVVRMRPPSQPPPMTGEPTKRGTPGSGVVIRRPPTAPPLLEGPRRGTPSGGVATGRSKTPGGVPLIEPVPEPEVVPPTGLANKLRYATLTVTISHVGIDARREDGFTRTVMWPDVVGIVARRLPPDEPYDGTTFIDIVSSAGATLRILPWTRLAGDRIEGEGMERARAFVQLAAARCPGAKLDAATRTFLGSHGPAAQLPDEPTLAAHDQRLS